MTEPFDAVSVIRTKRDRGRIPDAEVDWIIDAYTRGWSVPVPAVTTASLRRNKTWLT